MEYSGSRRFDDFNYLVTCPSPQPDGISFAKICIREFLPNTGFARERVQQGVLPCSELGYCDREFFVRRLIEQKQANANGTQSQSNS